MQQTVFPPYAVRIYTINVKVYKTFVYRKSFQDLRICFLALRRNHAGMDDQDGARTN